jgi:hypothetical protein
LDVVSAELDDVFKRIEEIVLAAVPDDDRELRVARKKLKLIGDILRRPDGHRRVLVRGPLSYNEDLLATRATTAWLDEERFQAAYSRARAVSVWGVDIRWRVYVACWAATHALHLEGDFVECGVDRGGLATAILHYLDFGRCAKTMYLLDTFQGLVHEQMTEREQRDIPVREGRYVDSYQDVVARFSAYPNIKVIRGRIPETLAQVSAEAVAYLSIDMNVAYPEIAAAEFFWERLSHGAVILLDDYGFPRHGEQREAFDKFAAERSVKVLALPTGQGLLLKP